MRNEPKAIRYKGHALRYCWCGYPEMRWMVYDHQDRWLSTHKTLKQAKQSIKSMKGKQNERLHHT